MAQDGPDDPQSTVADTAVFVSNSQNMLDLRNVATTVARTDVPVLILGESGVGKEVLARFIHRQSRRAHKPIVKVNCAALPDSLLESELFGYDPGAFTGAVAEKPGKFELANNARPPTNQLESQYSRPAAQHLLSGTVEQTQQVEISGPRKWAARRVG